MKITENRRPPLRGYGRAIRTLRAYRGMGQSELSKKSGYSIASLGSWEQGQVKPSEAARIDMCQVLHVPMEVMDVLAVETDPLVTAFSGWGHLLELEVKRAYTPVELCAAVGISMNSLFSYRREGVVNPSGRKNSLVYTLEDVEKAKKEKHRRARARVEGSSHRTGKKEENGEALGHSDTHTSG